MTFISFSLLVLRHVEQCYITFQLPIQYSMKSKASVAYTPYQDSLYFSSPKGDDRGCDGSKSQLHCE